MEWAARANRHNYCFDNPKTYKTVLGRMKKKYVRQAGSGPINDAVKVHGEFPDVQLYRRSFLEQATLLLQDKELMEGAYLGHEEPEGYYSSLNTGNWFRTVDSNLRRELRSPDRPTYPGRHINVGVILFDDATLCDRIGRLVSQPVMMTLANLSDKVRSTNDNAWRLLGKIPHYPKSSKEREGDRRKKSTQMRYLEYYHRCLKSLLQEVFELEKLKEGVLIEIPGEGVLCVHFHFCMLIGDSKGHADMCCHFNVHSAVIDRMARDCDIPQEHGDDPDYTCTMSLQEEIMNVVNESIEKIESRNQVGEARRNCKEISQHPIVPIYTRSRWGGCQHGVFGSCPYELLHLFYLGLLKYGLRALYGAVVVPPQMERWCRDREHNRPSGKLSARPTIAALKDLVRLFDQCVFEQRVRVVTDSSRRQSDRDMWRAPFKNGVSDLTRLTGQEYPGLCLVTIAAMKGMLGAGHELLERQFALLLFLSLSLQECLTAEEYTEEDLDELEQKIKVYLRFFRHLVGPQRECASKAGLRILKYHGLLHFPFYIRKYGKTANFFGGRCESLLKKLVKSQTKNTCRRQDRLDLDMMNRNHEDAVCQAARRHLEKKGHFVDPDAKEDTEASSFVAFEENTDGDEAPADEGDAASYTHTDGEEAPAAEGESASEDTRTYKVHKPCFVASLSDAGMWTISYKGKTDDGICYPAVGGNYGNDWVVAAVQYMDETFNSCEHFDGKYDSISFSFGCDVPTIGDNEHDCFRCHPSFHSFPNQRRPWHDWAMVKWQNEPIGESYSSAAKVLKPRK